MKGIPPRNIRRGIIRVSEGERMRIEWESGAEIRVTAEKASAVISANRAGLLSLARQLAALAEESPGSHIHYDAFNALEEGSAELIIEKTGA